MLIVLEQIISANRKELLGFDPRIASHNFAYNFMLFFPTMLISIILSITAVVLYLRARITLKQSGDRLYMSEQISIAPALLPFLGLLYVVVSIIYLIIKY
jgi:hypothetical protein